MGDPNLCVVRMTVKQEKSYAPGTQKHSAIGGPIEP
jgi:hypothetical protein